MSVQTILRRRRLCRFRVPALFVPATVFLAVAPLSQAASAPDPGLFEKEIRPILSRYCYDCHGDGASKGKLAFDGFKSTDELLAKRDLWLAVLKNTRAGLMPPEKKSRPSTIEQH